MRAALVASDFESPHAKSAFPRLLSLTQENNIDAVSLLGQIYMKQNKPAEAQELLSKAMTLKSSPISSPTTIPSPDPTLSTGPNPSTTLGLLHLQQKDIESALETFKTAAHTHDDPNAFYHLSTLEPRYSTRWIDYTLRAASSGHRTAAYNLGIFYALPLHEVLQRLDSSGRNELARFEKWWDGLLGQRESRRKKWALEWWYTAAMDGHAPAFLVYLKALWEGEGREECVTALAGLSVLVRDEGGGFAAQWPDVVEEARRYLRAWEREWEEWLEEDGGRKAREKLEALRGRSELGFRAWLYNI
ncbi:hypothetical protein M501DRAFT_235443 [Patellaria atrata CBS 101060]|uniref:TPR-like protein n=1 Tax=Patellaria atrata CBS 101060 TaxID=1346257 RepID=A0A9P4VP24_9PEZI|nr:hypothetical protein M501DRAFT_235443 [Patellaria atrata CBS 101060]